MLTLCGRLFALAVLLLALDARLLLAHTCGTTADCTALRGTTCMATCTEADVRAAIQVLNDCYPAGTPPPSPGVPNRVLKFDTAGCPTGCQVPTSLETFGPASCGSRATDPAGAYNAICITADNITIDGLAPNGARGVQFRYTGRYPCTSCSESCAGPQPALFLLQGSGITIQNLYSYDFYPEGIQIRKRPNGTGGSNNTITGFAEVRWYCEDAMTINGGTGNKITGTLFSGNTDPCASGNCIGSCWKERITSSQFNSVPQPCAVDADCGGQCSESFRNCTATNPCPANEGTCGSTIPGQRCHCNASGLFAGDAGGSCGGAGSGTCYRQALCGLDKAIQINGGTGILISHNTFNKTNKGVLVSDGIATADADVTNNSATGSTTAITLTQEPTFSVSAQNVCDSIGASHDKTANSATARFTSNSLSLCKFGIRSLKGANVTATGNTITSPYNSAFQISGTGGSLRGSLNRMKGDMSASYGRVLVQSSSATVDFGNPNGQENLFCGTGADVADNGGDADDFTNNCYDALPPDPNTTLTSGAKAITHADCVSRFPAGCGF